MSNMMFYIGPAIGVIATIATLVFVFRFLGKMASANKEAARVLSVGQPAVGQVVAAQQTGTYVNNNPQISLRINVTPHGGAPYQVQMTKIVGMLEIPQYQIGAHLDVRVDPANPSNVAIAGPLQPVSAQQPGYQGY